jgi:TRAP-type C4-dicarboxylate transport system substrate-binding protein
MGTHSSTARRERSGGRSGARGRPVTRRGPARPAGRRGRLAAAAVAALCLLATACEGQRVNSGGGAAKTLRYASIVPEKTALMEMYKGWAKDVGRATDGQVKFRSYYSGSLLAAGDDLAGIREGQADMGYLAPPYYPAEFPLWNVVAVPFVTGDPQAQSLALADLYESNKAFRQEFAEQGVRPLYFFPIGSTVLGTKTPVDSLDDLDGKRVRAVGLMGEALKSVGADVVATGAPEIYEGVERGVLDGYSAVTFDVMAGSALQEVAPRVTQTGLGNYASAATVISVKVWDALSPEQRTALEKASRTAVQGGMGKLAAAEDAACEAVKKADGTVSVLPEDEVERWKDKVAGKGVEGWRQSAREQGLDASTVDSFYEDYTAALDKHSRTSDYEDGMARCAGTG